jgi:putative membrane protein
MFIDYVTLLLTNTSAGFFLLAWYLLRGLDEEHPQRWVAAFAMVGLVALLSGFLLVQRWLLPGPFNMAYGELSVYFGVLFLGASLSLAKGWDLLFVAVYAFFAGIGSLLIGIRILELGVTNEPTISGIGFILSGLSGIFAALTLHLRDRKSLRVLGAAVLLATAILWARTGYKAYWSHFEHFSKWVPAIMEAAPQP